VKAYRVVRCWGSYIVYTISSQMAVKLAALRSGRALLRRLVFFFQFLALICVRGWGPYAAGRIRSINKVTDLIGSRTGYIPAYSIVPQPTALPINSECWCFRSVASQYIHCSQPNSSPGLHHGEGRSKRSITYFFKLSGYNWSHDSSVGIAIAWVWFPAVQDLSLLHRV
jgi:hypothetical protein